MNPDLECMPGGKIVWQSTARYLKKANLDRPSDTLSSVEDVHSPVLMVETGQT